MALRDVSRIFESGQNLKDFFTGVGQSAEQFETTRNLPEFNVSEFFTGLGASPVEATDEKTPTPEPTPTDTTGQPQGGGQLEPGKTEGVLKQAGELGLLQEEPSGPTVSQEEINAAFAPAFEALSSAESALSQEEQAGLGRIKSEKQQTIEDLRAEKKSRLSGFEQQRQRETGRTESAIAEASDRLHNSCKVFNQDLVVSTGGAQPIWFM